MKKLILTEQYWEAWSNWDFAMGWAGPDFNKFIELDQKLISGHHWKYIEVSDTTYKRIEMLVGPHHKSIIKAWLIKQSS